MNDPAASAISILVLIFSVIVHEVAHGWTALKFGDDTAERAGRLTLNPIPHIDPIGTIALPLLLFVTQSPLMFGWAKPVPINPSRFNDIRKGELFTAAAGVVANFALALIAGILFRVLFQGLNVGYSDMMRLLGGALVSMVYVNLALAVFNLIPIPPLDGSKVVLSQLPYEAARKYMEVERYGFLILILLIMIPIGGSTLIESLMRVTVLPLTQLLLGT